MVMTELMITDILVVGEGSARIGPPTRLRAPSYQSAFRPTFMNAPVRIAPPSHYTVGGLKIDVDGRTNLPNVYAAGELAGGVHGANRHGGVALVDGITFARIAGQHAARNIDGKPAGRGTSLLPPSRKAGREARFADLMGDLRRTNQFALGPIRNADRLQNAGERFAEFREKAFSSGWNDYAEMQEVLRVQRAILLSDFMCQAMLRRTESRGTHSRSDFTESTDAWLKKQVVALQDGELRLEEIAVSGSHGRKNELGKKRSEEQTCLSAALCGGAHVEQ
jgi:succinate dehydrogenase/fumarate reductase flavoprotein subunit